MIKSVVLLILVAARLIYQPAETNNKIAPFASHTPLPATTIPQPAKLISFSGSLHDNKVFLDWSVDDNETTYLFEVEKSNDGKNFSTAAIVFGNDIPDTGRYRFYEKAAGSKAMYRIKLVDKNKSAGYSPVVEIKPGV